MSILAMVSFSPFSAAISSSTGATILHGPHQVAQKSTRTGVLLDSTSAENESSVTATVALVSLMGLLLRWKSGTAQAFSLVCFAEPALAVDGGRTPHTGSGDGLAVGVVDEIAGGEDAFDRRVGGAPHDLHVTLVVELDLTANQLGPG